MSGFERSAPIPGSQGPRRSQMVRLNKAPPPPTPWRQEVLEAKKAAQKSIEAARRGNRSRSRSRDRARPDGDKDRELRDRQRGTAPAAESGQVLRHARQHGEGWYAAVAKAAEGWEKAEKDVMSKKGAAKEGHKQKDQQQTKSDRSKRSEKLRKHGQAQERERKEEQDQIGEEERERLAQEALERKRQEEYEAKAEERRLKAEEEKRKAEEERKRLEQERRQRHQRLKGAFAFDESDDDNVDRTTEMMHQHKEKEQASASRAVGTASALPGSTASSAADANLSVQLRFEPGLAAADAFMRLQERKRKGRRAEFGGPPRGCSPWRDGRKGISWDKKEEEERTQARAAAGPG